MCFLNCDNVFSSCLGEEPYKIIPPHQVVAQVGCGYRMSQPPKCSNEL